MAHNNGTITAPISLKADVAAVLGESKADVATVCMSDKINPYALYCPRWTLDPCSRITRDWTSPRVPPTAPSGVRYTLAPYGVYVPVISNIHTGLGAFNAARYLWVIERPDAASFKCLQHFDGYNHYATVSPIAESVYAVPDQEIVVNINLPKADGSSLSPANLFADPDSQGNRYYLCLVVYESSSATPYDFTTPRSIVRSNGYITAQGLTETLWTNVNAIAGRYYTIVPVVCKKQGVGTDVFPTDYDFLGIKVADNMSPWIDRYIPTMEENTPQLQYFWWMENYARCYPDGSTVDNGTPLPQGVNADIVLDYCENPGDGSTVWAKYRQIQLAVTVRNGAGNTAVFNYTWTKGAAEGALRVDERCYTRGNYRHHLLMSLSGLWEQAYATLGSREVYISSVAAAMTDSATGTTYDPVTATCRPDDPTEE